MKRVFIETFGCQMNKLDSELSIGLLQDSGCEMVANAEEADVILFNTCSVRKHAEDKVYSRIGALRSRKGTDSGLIIGVLGCMGQKDGKEIFRRMPHVDLVCGTRMFSELPSLLERVNKNGKHLLAIEEDKVVSFNRSVSQRPNPYQAFVSVMRGCNHCCSYCIVPFVRGREVSRPVGDIVDEARRLAQDGCKEVMLLGQNISSYGHDNVQGGLAQLLREVNQIDGLERIRFVTSHPKDMTRDVFEAIGSLPKVCEYLHMPPQSGSDRVLKRMRRLYTAAHYRELIDQARELAPGIAIAGDFIVGFPGETDEDFEESVNLMRDIRFQCCFIFKYSPRSGTKAVELTDDVPEETKKERNQILLGLQKEISTEENKKMIGKTVEVLVEGPSKSDPNRVSGRTRLNQIVVFEGTPVLAGKLINVTVHDSTDLTLFAAM
jgi:tRNA-2-methylthio-N6-dimethylallyladenosine synthase